MRKGLHRLDEVVLPAVHNGADAEHFARMDRERGLSYEHGYERVYDAFFRDDAIHLDERADGSFGVTNGYHRMTLARALGFTTLPARVDRTGDP